jgi:ADP-heptose:LPS heptosyltransferase
MLQISDSRERLIVRTADAALSVLAPLQRALRRRSSKSDPARVLLLRLERIGDLVMALPAIRDVRVLAPSAEIDLVVGSWNASLGKAVPHVSRVEIVDARWLARDRDGLGLAALLRRASAWKTRQYDLAINFEPDIRTNLMLAAAGSARTAGWTSGGGGPVLDLALDYDSRSHTSVNARRLVATAFGRQPAPSATPLLTIPDAVLAAAADRLRAAHGRPLVGVHVSGGRAIKQWDPSRFASVAARLADSRNAVIVATGAAVDRALVGALQASLAPRLVIDASEDDLLLSTALLAQIDVLVTGDTGPMHLASAVGTSVVAIFGPSDPARYATAGAHDRIVRVDLPCSPCNRIRRPPNRCIGHTPDCLARVGEGEVFAAAAAVLDGCRSRISRAGVHD